MDPFVHAVRALPKTASIFPLEPALQRWTSLDDEAIDAQVTVWEDHIVMRAVRILRNRMTGAATPRDVAECARIVAFIKRIQEDPHEPRADSKRES